MTALLFVIDLCGRRIKQRARRFSVRTIESYQRVTALLRRGEKFYNQADMTSALRRFQVAVMAAREDRRLAPTLHPGQTIVMARENNNPSP
jgi:hypothetical protein